MLKSKYLEVTYTAGNVMDLASALVITLCPANGSICVPFMGNPSANMLALPSA